MANKTIEIIVDVNDKTGGKLKGAQQALIDMDRTAQRLANRFKSFSTTKYQATVRLIDRVTEPGTRINNLLRRIAGTAWRVSLHLADGALDKVRRVEAILMRITSRAYNIAVNVRDNLKGTFGSLLNGAAMGAGMLMPLGGAMGIGFGAVNAVQAYAGFEQQMSKVQAIRQLSKDSGEMKQLTQLAKDLGASTAWTRQQVGEAMQYQALAGWSTGQILQSTPHILNLASAGGLDLGRTSDIVTDAMTAFGLRAEETYTNKQGREVNAVEHFADMLAKMQAISNTDISQAGEAFKYGASTIGAMYSGKDIQTRMQATEDAMIMTGLMANAGIKGSMAGTGINTIFNRMGSMNRNAYRALGAMGVEYKDERGDMLSVGTIMRNLSRRFKEGIDPNQLLTFAEEIAGEKIHADTRRKLDSLIEQTTKNGGKMGSSDMLKMAGMLAGTEHMGKLLAVMLGDWDAMAEKMDNVGGTAADMAGTMLDNLAGSFTILGSAWDAFQQDLLEGTAGSGLRGFVDTLTELVTRLNKLFSDGIDIGDFGKIIGDIIGRLKNKFLELDGIGSVLAGGALAAGLMKIITLSQRALNAIRNVGKASVIGATGAGSTGVSAAQKVGTMHVSAGVVNVNGKVGGSGAGGAGGGGGAGKAGGAAAGALSAVALAQQNLAKARAQYDAATIAAWANPKGVQLYDYRQAQKGLVQAETALINARVAAYKDQIAQGKAAVATAREEAKLANAARWSNIKSSAAGGAAFAAIFGAMDIMSLKAMNAERLANATDENRAQIIRENRQAEWEAGAGLTGSVIGAAIGSALGSLAGPIGTAIGGVVGGMIGQLVGSEAGKTGAQNEQNNSSNVDMGQISEHVPGHKQPQPDYSFGQTQPPKQKDWKDFKDFSELMKRPSKNLAQLTTQNAKTTEDYITGLQNELAAREKAEHEAWARSRDFGATWQGNAAAPELYKANQTYDINDLFFNKASAAELNAEQLAQMQAMERGEVVITPTVELGEVQTDTFAESLYSQLESIAEGAGEVMSNLGTTITEGLASAGAAASAALESIQSAFASAKDTVVSAWGELPGFFEGVFSGLGSAASAAGSAIYSGLTSVIGSVIGAWESASATIGGIISQIGSMAASAGAGVSGAVSSVIARVRGHAEGGFVTSPELSWIGERGPELVLPLTDRERSLELLGQASGMLGLDSGLPSDSIVSQGSATSSLDVGGVTINASFTISGGEDVMQTIQENLEDLADKVAAKFSANIQTCYRNQALAS